MRIWGWVLLIGGVLLCASIVWAAIGFLFMGFGLIFLQVAEGKRRRLAELPASRPEISDLPREPPPLQEISQTLTLWDKDVLEPVGRERTVASYDKGRWLAVLRNDAEIAQLAKVLVPYGQKYVDELAAAYLVLNDEKYLPMILRKIIESARRDSAQNAMGERLDPLSNTAAGRTLGMNQPADRVRDLDPDRDDDAVSRNNVAAMGGSGLSKVQVSQPLQRNPGRETAIEQTGHGEPTKVAYVASDQSEAERIEIEEAKLRQALTFFAASGLSAGRQTAGEAADANPPEIAVVPGGHDEKKATREVDAVDADNLTDILNQTDRVLTSEGQ
jgi:hypothetical protein